MISCKIKLVLVVCILYADASFSQKTVAPSFTVIPLGVKGGSDESNLSSYMLAANRSND